MARPHILIIPPWFDIDFRHHFSKNYHRWARDLAERNEVKVGLLYGEFNAGFRRHRMHQNQNVNYHYLGVSDWGLPKAGPGWWLWKRQYLRAFEEYVSRYGRPTVIHGFSLLGVIAAGTIGQQYGVPYAYTEVLGSFINGQATRRLVRQAGPVVEKAALVCGISPGMRDALERTYGGKAVLIPLYVDPKIFTLAPMPSGPPRFISIGSPAHIKGLDVLIEAMQYVVHSHRDARLVIVAEPRDEQLLLSRISKYGLAKNVELRGPVAHIEIPGLLRQAHVLVSASRTESLGFTLIEALASGRPVVATATPGGQYIVTERMGSLVPLSEPDGGADPRALARAMIDIFDRLQSYPPQILHGAVLSRFGKTKILNQWMDHYSRISNQDRI